MNQEFRRDVWQSGVWALLGLVLFVVAMGSIPQPDFRGLHLIAAGVGLALIPALLWLAFFFRQNRRQPEPKRIVWRVFLFSGLIASGVGVRLVDDLFRIETWLYGSAWLRLFGVITIVGFTQEFLKYFVVRHTVFPTEEFKDLIDGVIYGVVAGLGYATVLNIQYVIDNQGVLLYVGSMHMVVTALAQAGFSAVTCYFLAGAKYGEKPIWWVPAGLTLAAFLNGLFSHLRHEITLRGLTHNPWKTFFLATGFVILVLGILFSMIHRAERKTAIDI